MTNPPTSDTSAPSAAYTPPVDTTTPLVAAFVGKNWDSHYKGAWRKLGSRTGLRGGTSWNWPAALFTTYWLLYRRQYLYAGGVFIGTIVVRQLNPLVGLLVWLALIVLFGMYGDRIVLGSAYKTVDEAVRQHGPGDEARAVVAAAGGVNSVILFILVIPVIILTGILAAIAIPKFASVRQKAYETQMRADLQNLVTFEQTAFGTNGKYTDDLGGFVPTNGVTRPGITLTSDSSGFVATVRHANVPNRVCGVAVNMPNPVLTTAASGEPACK